MRHWPLHKSRCCVGADGDAFVGEAIPEATADCREDACDSALHVGLVLDEFKPTWYRETVETLVLLSTKTLLWKRMGVVSNVAIVARAIALKEHGDLTDADAWIKEYLEETPNALLGLGVSFVKACTDWYDSDPSHLKAASRTFKLLYTLCGEWQTKYTKNAVSTTDLTKDVSLEETRDLEMQQRILNSVFLIIPISDMDDKIGNTLVNHIARVISSWWGTSVVVARCLACAEDIFNEGDNPMRSVPMGGVTTRMYNQVLKVVKKYSKVTADTHTEWIYGALNGNTPQNIGDVDAIAKTTGWLARVGIYYLETISPSLRRLQEDSIKLNKRILDMTDPKTSSSQIDAVELLKVLQPIAAEMVKTTSDKNNPTWDVVDYATMLKKYHV